MSNINNCIASNNNISNKSKENNKNKNIKTSINEPIPPQILIYSSYRLENIFNIKKEFLLAVSRIESNYKQIHSPYYNSTANGPYQFTENGWRGDIDLCVNSNKLPKVNMSKIYNVNNRINYKKSSFILACAMSAIKDKIDSKYNNEQDKYTIIYLNHFLGTYDTIRLEDNILKNPNMRVTKIFSKDKINKNKTLFYVNGPKTTISDFFNNIKNIINEKSETIKKILQSTQKSM